MERLPEEKGRSLISRRGSKRGKEPVFWFPANNQFNKKYTCVASRGSSVSLSVVM